MKELDFDELDRAVNTLMGGVQSSASPKSTDDETTVITIPSTITSASSPVMPRFTSPASRPTAAEPAEIQSAPSTVEERSVEQTAPTASRLAIPSRRAGRFMDVVHPSSDMKNPSNAPSDRPSRTAALITPLVTSDVVTQTDATDSIPEEMTTYEAVAEPDTLAESAPAATVDEADVPTASADADADAVTVNSTNDWPDPLADFGAEPTQVATVADGATLAVNEVTVADGEDEDGDDDLFTIDTTEPDDEPEPLTSPFLTDAKVDKRPLGAQSEAASDEPGRAPVLGAIASEALTQSDPDDQLPADPVEQIEQVLPAELQNDLIAVESDNDSFTATEETVAEPVAHPTELSTEPQPVTATGPTSIQQQYKESAATGDQTNGAIYDTQAYHQPLAHPVKKKSGWMWVIWVLLLLIVGAGGAVALYYFELI